MLCVSIVWKGEKKKQPSLASSNKTSMFRMHTQFATIARALARFTPRPFVRLSFRMSFLFTKFCECVDALRLSNPFGKNWIVGERARNERNSLALTRVSSTPPLKRPFNRARPHDGSVERMRARTFCTHMVYDHS